MNWFYLCRMQTLKDFLIDNNGKYIIDEYEKYTGMSDRNRKALMNHAIDFMIIFDEKEDYFTNFPYLFCESGLVSL